MTDADPKVLVRVPQDEKMLKLINLTAKYVSADGESIEQVSAVSMLLLNYTGCF